MIIDKQEHKEFLISVLENFDLRAKGKDALNVVSFFNEVLETVKDAEIKKETKLKKVE